MFVPAHPTTSDFSEDVHEIQLIKKVVNVYIDLKGRSHAHMLTLQKQGNTTSVRSKLNKLVIFKHV